MPAFELGADVHANVAQLLKALGSVKRPLSFGDLAELLNARDAQRNRYPSTVQGWVKGVVPDLRSIKLMAELAGVSFEEFALGSVETAAEPATSLERAIEATNQPGRGAQLEEADVPAPRRATKKVAESKRRPA